MRKLNAGLAGLLVLALLALLAGCGGGDTAKAKQYMKAGYDLLQKAITEASDWQTQVSPLTTAPDPATIKGTAQQAKDAGNAVIKTADEAKAEYKKIEGLSGVGDYKKYANLQMQEIDAVTEIITKLNATLDKEVAMVSTGDVTGVQSLWQTLKNELKPVSDKATKYEQDASKLKTDKKL